MKTAIGILGSVAVGITAFVVVQTLSANWPTFVRALTVQQAQLSNVLNPSFFSQ
jgi:hypothetical protein